MYKLHSIIFFSMSEFKFEEHNFEGKLIFIIGSRASGKTTLAKDFLIKVSNKQKIGILNIFSEYTNFLPNSIIYNSHCDIHSVVNGNTYYPELLVIDTYFDRYKYFNEYIMKRKIINKTTIIAYQRLLDLNLQIRNTIDYYFICLKTDVFTSLNIFYNNLSNFNINLFNDTFVKCLQNNLVLVIKRCAKDGEEQIFWYKMPNPKYIEAYPQIKTIQKSVRNYLSKKKENSQLLSDTLFDVGYNPDYIHSFMYKKSLKNFVKKK